MKWGFRKKEKSLPVPTVPTITKLEAKPEKVSGYINPIWEIEVSHRGKQLVKMPLCFLVHTHLKDYGFNPDDLVNDSPDIIFRLGKGSEAKLKLFVKDLPKEWK